MSEISIIEPTSFIAMPWRNGLGTTIELLKQDLPDGDGFAWRLSMADVTTNGAFSNFSGYQRTLLLLEGKGLTLDNNSASHRLEKPLQSARFSGDDQTFATLHDGPVKDFNIMVQRQRCSARVSSPETAPPCWCRGFHGPPARRVGRKWVVSSPSHPSALSRTRNRPSSGCAWVMVAGA